MMGHLRENPWNARRFRIFPLVFDMERITGKDKEAAGIPWIFAYVSHHLCNPRV